MLSTWQLPRIESSLVIEEARKFQPWTEFMYTDEPVYSFHCGLPMPPDLAVLPLKRFWAGEMTNARLTQELEEIKPGIILLANTTAPFPFQHLLQTEYRVVYEDARHRLFARPALAKLAGF